MRFFLSFWAVFALAAPVGAACPELTTGFSASVARVLDAETLRLHDGSEVRLAGILTPRRDDAGAAADVWPAAVAAKAQVEALVLGQSIGIAFGSERRDRYGRHLGHVIRDDGPDKRWLQEHLLRQGLARVALRGEDRACEQEMLAAERAAREAGLGLWKEAAYRIREAGDLETLQALVGTFQLIEGTVSDSRRYGSGLRVEFVQKGTFGLVAILRRQKGPPALVPSKGHRMRLRGWLEERGGRPTLDLTAIGGVEALEAQGDWRRPRDTLPLRP